MGCIPPLDIGGPLGAFIPGGVGYTGLLGPLGGGPEKGGPPWPIGGPG